MLYVRLDHDAMHPVMLDITYYCEQMRMRHRQAVLLRCRTGLGRDTSPS